MLLRLLLALLSAAVLSPPLLQAQAPAIIKIDPPNWWAAMPEAPMLLVRGGGLSGSTFSISDPALHIASQTISANGHWAVLHLSAAPAAPENVIVSVAGPGGKTSAPFQFDKRRPASDGFAGFSSKDVMYLIMTDRFADGDSTNDEPDHAAELAKPRGWHGGDLRGVLDHLPYLQTLGITTVWTTPVYSNAGEPDSYHGYGATDMYAVDPHFGTLADFQTLARALHERHMKLVLDTVPNHVGPKNPWVTDEPEPDWFHGTLAHHDKAVGEFAPLVNPHAAWRDQRDILQGWFADTLPDMNQENPDVAQYLIQNAIWWVEQTGADGLRIDTFPYVGRPFWHEFHARLRQLYPNLTSVGEVFNADPVITSAFAGGVTRDDLNGSVDTGLTTPFDFPTYFTLRKVLLKDQPMTEMADILRQDSLYPHPERLVPFLGNHDTARFLSEPGATPEKLKLAFAMLLTMRGMPQIYSGDEIAMQGGADPDNRRDFPGGFAGSGPGAFVPAQRTPEQRETFDWVQNLLKLRARYPELNSGEEQVLYSDADTLVYVRGASLDEGCGGGRGRILVTVNKSSAPKTISLAMQETALAGCTYPHPVLGSVRNAGEQLTVPSGAGLVYWTSLMPQLSR